VTELAQPVPGVPVIRPAEALFDPDMDFRKLALEATYRTQGFRLAEKDALEGVPHIVIGLRYHPGFTDKSGIQWDYVSCESVVADAETLAMPQFELVPADLRVFPNQAVVYNDGGKGIRRSFTKMLHNAEVIDVGRGTGEDDDFDAPFSQWASGAALAQDGIRAIDGKPFRYVVIYGLRRSDYENEYGPGTTWYLA